MIYHKKDTDTFELPFLKWSIIGASIGIIIGLVIALFLLCLESATKFRNNNPYILFLLPIGGVLVSFLYYKYGSNSSKGNNLIIEKINEGCEDIPLLMTPLVFFGTVVTHLLGGSAGREGTGVQIGASIGENIGKLLKLNKYENRIIIMAGVSGGFSAIFGTPLAGTIFGLEVSVIGKMSYEALIPCLAASILGNSVVSFLGIKHSHYIIKGIPNLSILIAFKIVLASIVFGLISRLFSELTYKLKHIFSKVFKNIFVKSFTGGILVIVLTFIIGTYKYLGLSLPLMENAFKGYVHPMDFLGKLVFTSVTLGSGYQGGEVTPLFVIGSTLGSSLSALLNLSPSFLASLGLISVFTGATNTPVASFILGIEMFGSKGAIYMLIVCSISYTFSGHTGIYTSQSIGIKKSTVTFLKNIFNC